MARVLQQAKRSWTCLWYIWPFDFQRGVELRQSFCILEISGKACWWCSTSRFLFTGSACEVEFLSGREWDQGIHGSLRVLERVDCSKILQIRRATPSRCTSGGSVLICLWSLSQCWELCKVAIQSREEQLKRCIKPAGVVLPWIAWVLIRLSNNRRMRRTNQVTVPFLESKSPVVPWVC